MLDSIKVSSSFGTDSLIGIERVRFSDVTLAFDADGNAGQVYRLYQAAFDRTPDTDGLSYWINNMDHGTSLLKVAQGFIESPEFAGLYGANPSSETFVTSLYSNVLHRAPDADGKAYWVNQLESHLQTQAQVLTGFSESPENQAALAPTLAQGVTFVPSDYVPPDPTPNTINGTSGNDVLTGTSANDVINGLAGLDTVVYADARTNYIHQTNGQITVTDLRGNTGVDTLNAVERVQFADETLAFDADGNAGQVYRLYQAAFDRTPDTGGLTGWVNYMDNGASLLNVATSFIASPEFATLYGTNPSSETFVINLYNNVLHRAPDADGKAYWVNQIDSHLQTEAQVLTGFAESPENQAALIGVIEQGIVMNHV
jgi:hypothetical protein